MDGLQLWTLPGFQWHSVKQGLKAEGIFLLRSPGRQRTRGRPPLQVERVFQSKASRKKHCFQGCEGVCERNPQLEGKALDRGPSHLHSNHQENPILKPHHLSKPWLYPPALYFTSHPKSLFHYKPNIKTLLFHEKSMRNMWGLWEPRDRLYKSRGPQFHVERHHGILHNALVFLFASLFPCWRWVRGLVVAKHSFYHWAS